MNLSVLLNHGLTYGQIASIIEQLINKEYVRLADEHFEVTEAGKRQLTEGFKKLGLTRKETWILPQKQYYHEPISEKEVILPDKL